jgi:hypothetical protein
MSKHTSLILSLQLTRGYQWIVFSRISGHMCILIKFKKTENISGFHQNVQVFTARMYGYPSRMISFLWAFDTANEFKFTIIALFVAPDAVGPHICRIQIGFCWVENHAVYRARLQVGVVLQILKEATFIIYAKDISVASVFVKRIAID